MRPARKFSYSAQHRIFVSGMSTWFQRVFGVSGPHIGEFNAERFRGPVAAASAASASPLPQHGIEVAAQTVSLRIS